jgi:membrane protease YdiL (CAAX protease family)
MSLDAPAVPSAAAAAAAPAAPMRKPSRHELSRLAIDLYMDSAQGAIARSADLLRQAKRVTRCLFSVALMQTINAFLQLIEPVSPELAATARLTAVAGAVLAVLFWAFGAWSVRSPLPAALAGLAVYAAMGWSGSAYADAVVSRQFGEQAAVAAAIYPTLRTLVKVSIVIALVRALWAGVRHREVAELIKLFKPMPGSVGGHDESLVLSRLPERQRVANVAGILALLGVMLWLNCDLTTRWGRGDLTPVLFSQFVVVGSAIVVIWSILCWRDVYPLVAWPIHPAWHLIAVALGGATFAAARGWMVLVQSWTDLSMFDPALIGGSGIADWRVAILLLAVAPAIAEELAFRGVIFGSLARSLKGWETVAVTALMFMVLHVNVASFPPMLLAGVVLGVLRLKSGSWIPGVFLHFVHSFLTLAYPQ